MDCVNCQKEIIGYKIAFISSVCKENHLTCISCANKYGPVCGACKSPLLFCDINRESCALVLLIDMSNQNFPRRTDISNYITSDAMAAEEEVIEEHVLEEEDNLNDLNITIEDEDSEYDNESLKIRTEIKNIAERMIVQIENSSQSSLSKAVDTSDLDNHRASSLNLNIHPTLFERKPMQQMSYSTLLNTTPHKEKELERVAGMNSNVIGVYYDEYGKMQEIQSQKEPNICYTNPNLGNSINDDLRLYIWRIVKENNATKSVMFVVSKPETDQRLRATLDLIQDDDAPRWTSRLLRQYI